MFERFTDRARSTVVLAQQEARRLNHNYIGTEHVLLGLLAIPEGVAAKVLNEMGIGSDAVRAELVDIVGRGDETPKGHIPFTPRCKKVLELSLREALALRHNYIGTEHILLGLLREGEGVASQILVKRGAELDDVRKLVLAHLGTGGVAATARSWTWRRRQRTPAADDVVEAAERLASGGPVGSHHLLEALARAEGSMAHEVLAALGVDADAIAAQLDRLRPEDTSDMTPEEAGARQMELRLDNDEVHVVLRDGVTLALARSVVEQAGGPVSGDDPVAGGFVPLWNETQTLLTGLLAALAPAPPEPEPGTGRSLLVQRVIQSRLARRRRRPPES